MFQSSPVPKDGCNANPDVIAPQLGEFQSSPVPKDGCNASCRNAGRWKSCFNPHPSRRTGATCPKIGTTLGSIVSILTRPEGRVQLRFPATRSTTIAVSILTRPEGRVQLAIRAAATASRSFNPHPSRRTGATRRRAADSRTAGVSILTRPEGRVQPRSSGSAFGLSTVSILTRPEGRVQRGKMRILNFTQHVSILTRPEGRVQLAGKADFRIEGGFNPHPSRRTGATRNGRRFSRRSSVSILTRPEGRVQPGITSMLPLWI